MLETIASVQCSLHQASSSLKRALAYWWPAQGNADVSEATYVLHCACALNGHGWLTYAEVQVAGVPSAHFDLVAVHPEHRCVLVVEAKQLYSVEKACSLGQDWERLKTNGVPSQYRPLPSDLCRYGCLVASCWVDQNASYVDWWRSDLACDRPRGVTNPNDWSVLHRVLKEADDHGVRGAISVHAEDRAWLLYAVAPLPSLAR
jgi:hypothetical protein